MYSVVLVDDEQVILHGLAQAFPWEEFGCLVAGTAGDGVEGAALIRMPNLNGLNMVAALKSEFPRLQIAVLTAYRDFEYARQAIQLGVCRYLLKPSKMEELKEAVGYMTSAIAALPPAPAEEPPENEAAGSFVVKAAMTYLEQHFVEHVTLSQVADHVYVSQWHLSKLINKHLNKNFFDILNELRIQKARELLNDPSLRVHEIAEQVGFADVAHFSKNFKRLTGRSPVEYRARL